MTMIIKPSFYIGALCMTLAQNSFASHSEFVQTLFQETEQPDVSIILAGRDPRVELRQDRRNNRDDQYDDMQNFREDRRDCDGAGCRSDNRQDNRENRRDRTDDRRDDRQDRRRY